MKDQDNVSHVETVIMRTSYMFGLLYIANVVDNTNSPWFYIAFCEVACALLLSW